KILTIALLMAAATFISSTAKADDPPPPPPGHGETGNVPGGGAPIGSGLFILLGLGVAYGGKKIYDCKKKKSVEY
ncbi:MAG: hypothetical protein JEY97_14905, partial [Bacteroidales bacterium]|nr:hypothetical protein [Bacteroidales bacterium]